MWDVKVEWVKNICFLIFFTLLPFYPINIYISLVCDNCMVHYCIESQSKLDEIDDGGVFRMQLNGLH